jgi:hypothetical protein
MVINMLGSLYVIFVNTAICCGEQGENGGIFFRDRSSANSCGFSPFSRMRADSQAGGSVQALPAIHHVLDPPSQNDPETPFTAALGRRNTEQKEPSGFGDPGRTSREKYDTPATDGLSVGIILYLNGHGCQHVVVIGTLRASAR